MLTVEPQSRKARLWLVHCKIYAAAPIIVDCVNRCAAKHDFSRPIHRMVHLVDMSNNCMIASLDVMSSGSGSTETQAVVAAGGNYCG